MSVHSIKTPEGAELQWEDSTEMTGDGLYLVTSDGVPVPRPSDYDVEDFVYIAWLHVPPEHRGKGLGKRLNEEFMTGPGRGRNVLTCLISDHEECDDPCRGHRMYYDLYRHGFRTVQEKTWMMRRVLDGRPGEVKRSTV
jgi:GNAT superfamily N-acetyltransferase